jgi:purine/pyrimidine-nucleoside phosphorylase
MEGHPPGAARQQMESTKPGPALATQFNGVSVVAKANVYFEGAVVSHTILLADGQKKTLGVIRPGSFHFNTDAPELMEIVEGTCRVTIDGSQASSIHGQGSQFQVPGKSGFLIEVDGGSCQYICSFLS